MSFSLYGIRDFRVEYWTGSSWVTCGEVTGNDKVWRKFSFAAVMSTKIRVYVTGGEATRSRIVEVEAYKASSQHQLPLPLRIIGYTTHRFVSPGF